MTIIHLAPVRSLWAACCVISLSACATLDSPAPLTHPRVVERDLAGERERMAERLSERAPERAPERATAAPDRSPAAPRVTR
jgi:hypothetical protein